MVVRRLANASYLHLLIVTLALQAGCATAPVETAAPSADQEDEDVVQEETLLFQCKPVAGAPHDMINVFAVDPDQAAAGSGSDVGRHVLIELNQVDDGIAGYCEPEAAGAAHKARYACVSTDESLRLVWPGDGSATSATVEVKEKWLFWTKTYTAGCQRKA